MIYKIGDYSIAYDDVGEGQEVILIHGFPLSKAMWGPQVGSLVASGYRVVTLDLPGFGESDAIPVESMADYADIVLNLMDYLRIRRAVMGGMSMGGYVLLNFMARYPEKLDAALLIVTRADGDEPAAIERREAMIQQVLEGKKEDVLNAFLPLLFGDSPDSDLVQLVKSWTMQAKPEGLVNALIAMKNRIERYHTLNGIELPCWILTADQDKAIDPSFAMEMEKCISNCRLEIIKGAGHMVNQEKSTEFNQILLNFLNEIFPF